MLQAHSILWHYLWVGPNLLLLALAINLRIRGMQRVIPIFLLFAFVTSIEQLFLYGADVIPTVSGELFWRLCWLGLLIEALVKFALIAEIFGRLFGRYSSLALLGKRIIHGFGIGLVMLATVAAAYAPIDNPRYSIISYAHILDQTIYFVESGVLLFIFLFAAYFHVSWDRSSYGIGLGLAVSSCVHLATWAVMANGGMLDSRYLLDFVNMAAYHLCVLIWFYYLLTPQKKSVPSTVSLPENNLAIWNRELERLLQ